MKRIFGRDKPKMVKVTSAQTASGPAVLDSDGAPGDRQSQQKHEHAHRGEEDAHRGEEKKEKKGFWSSGLDREREKAREREREREKDKYRKEEESPAELTRMIGYLTATSSEDWSLVLEVCNRASESEANAKEAVKALRREFKYAEPSAQLAAARLWAIMSRNSSEIFVQEMVSRKFLDTLEDVLTSSRTSPVVRERLMDVLAAVAYASQNKAGRGDKDGFRALWRKVKPADQPDEGVPFEIDDAMFNPPMPRPTSEYPLEHHQPYQLPNDQALQQLPEAVAQVNPAQAPKAKKRSSQRKNRIIPVEEDIRWLFQECALGNGNAQLLSQALTYARPEDLKENDLIKKYFAYCRSSQELIYAQIPWTSAGAQRSRAAKGSPPLSQKSHSNSSYPAAQTQDDDTPAPESTIEEDLLAAVLVSNEALTDALRVYDDLERVGIEKEREEISRRDVRMDRRTLAHQEEYGDQLEPPRVTGASSSRSPSPSPRASPVMPFQQPAYIPSVNYPLPRIPNNLIPGAAPSPLPSPYSPQNGGLVPPPPAPHGPRSPAFVTASRTPYPERYSSPTLAQQEECGAQLESPHVSGPSSSRSPLLDIDDATVNTPALDRPHSVPNQPTGPTTSSNRPGPSSSSSYRHVEPKLWAERDTEPLSSAAQRSGAVRTPPGQPEEDRDSYPPPSYHSQTRSSDSFSELSVPIQVHSHDRIAGPQWVAPDTSTVPDFSHLPSATSSILTNSIGGHQPFVALIHRDKLQSLEKLMDEALCAPSSNVRHLTDPVGWLEAEGEYIIKILQDIAAIVQDDAIVDLLGGAAKMAFPRLMVYTLAHLMFCANDIWALEVLKKYIAEWHKMGAISRLENHIVIKAWLFELCGRFQHDTTMHPEHTARDIAVMDVIGLSAHLVVAITDDNHYREFYARRFVSAQLLLDLLQARLDLYIDPAFKQRHVKALVKLSASSGLFPTCLVLSDVTLEPDPFASGGSGEVYKGALRGHLIAVKMLKVYRSSVVAKILREFAREAVTWRQLSHPNVLPFYGVYHLNKASPRVCLVSPWMEQGNVVEYLARADETGQIVDCVTLALDVAKGLEHLHSVNIIHADLKGLNILITHSLRACLADFGLSATRNSSQPYMQNAISSTGHATGTLRWQAPELFPSFESTGSTNSDHKFHNTKATDIYAYAMTVYELFSGIYPFTGRFVSDYQVIRAVGQGTRPSRPTDSRAIARGLDDAVWKIINECWAQDPHSRPPSETVVLRLEGRLGLAEDIRVKDGFDLGLLTKVLQAKTEHPFATLVVDGPEAANK